MAEYGVIGCYYNSQTTGQSDTGKGEPRTTLQMTYSYAVGVYMNWNFEGHIWQDDVDNTNDGYPEFGIGNFKPEPTYPKNDNIMYVGSYITPTPTQNDNIAYVGNYITPTPIQNDNIMYVSEYTPVTPVTITHNLINNTIVME